MQSIKSSLSERGKEEEYEKAWKGILKPKIMPDWTASSKLEVAGLLSMCDWIASNDYLFPVGIQDSRSYFMEKVTIMPSRKPEYRGFKDLTGYSPRKRQFRQS